MAYYDLLDTPVGLLFIGGSADGLARLDFLNRETDALASVTRLERLTGDTATRGGPECHEVRRQLGEYFAGTRRTFDLVLAPHGTDWQQRVWMALRDIPYGETVNYGTIAARVGHPTASRAVGAANGRNPISIIVPCHRVVGANRDLTGYGGGLERKQWLLEHEGTRLPLGAPKVVLAPA